MARTVDESRLLALIDALADGRWVSGDTLAAQSGVTRQALSMRMRHLVDWGIEIERRPGRGYRMRKPLQRLDATRILEMLPIKCRNVLKLSVVARLDSTNSRLMSQSAADDPQALLAEQQTAGRGRRGRSWSSPFGANLYLSLSWSFPSWPSQLSALSLVAGVCVVRALHTVGAGTIGLKWPNDIRVGESKLGGILIEQRGEAGGACRVVIGVGINVTMSATQAGDIDQAWTTLEQALATGGKDGVDRNILAAGLLHQLIDGLQYFQQQGFQPFQSEWLKLDQTRNRPVTVSGAERLRGIARGIDTTGALLVETDGGIVAVHAGDVSLRVS